MRFLQLEAKNFMSFKEFTLSFPPNGLVFVGGEIEDGKISSSNGAGKSAVFEALCWGLYGQTLRNVGKSDVMNWSVGKDCMVEIIFEDDHGEVCIIRRYRNDKKLQHSLLFFKGNLELKELTSSDAKETQAIIDSVLGMNWLVFSTAVIFGEKAQRFTEARDSEKKQIFDEILMLQKYQDAQKQVREDLRKIREESAQYITQKMAAEEGLKAVSETLTQRAEELEQLELRKADAEERIGWLQSGLETTRRKMTAKKAEADAGKAEYASLDAENKNIFTMVQKLEREKQSKLSEVTNIGMGKKVLLATTISSIKGLETKKSNALQMRAGALCPTCGQNITPESLTGVTGHFEEEIEKLKLQRDSLSIEVSKFDVQEREIRSKYDKEVTTIVATKTSMDDTLSSLLKAYTEKALEAKSLEGEVRAGEQEIMNLQQSFKEKEDALHKSIDYESERITGYENNIRDLDQKLREYELEEKILGFWEDGFGNTGIKSLLLDEVIPQLNARVGFYANALMDDEITINFDTESTLKSGESRDKFDVKVTKAGERIDYAACSSGEKRRIDVAILLALQSLVYERGASNSNLIVLDEVFDSLDRVGIERAVALLAEESSDKLIYVISHLSEFRDYFQKELLITKENGFSNLVDHQEGDMS